MTQVENGWGRLTTWSPPAPGEVLVVQHVPWETPGRLGRQLTAQGVPWTPSILLDTAYAAGDPDVTGLAGLVIMGGPMGALDVVDHPGLEFEARLVRAAVEAGVPLFGICLGHQVIATALGAQLHRDVAHEIGLGRASILHDGPLGRAGESIPVLHWHFDAVDSPPGATVLASSEQTANQAYVLGSSTFSTQFHLEVDHELLSSWLAIPEMVGGVPGISSAQLLADFRDADPEIRVVAEELFGLFCDCVANRVASLPARAPFPRSPDAPHTPAKGVRS